MDRTDPTDLWNAKAEDIEPAAAMSLRWTNSYFEDRRVDDPPWKHFTTGFAWFHLPLRHY